MTFRIKEDNPGDTVVVLSKKEQKRREAIAKAMKKAMNEWEKLPKEECVALETFGGMYEGHPKERTFQAIKGKKLVLPKTQVKSLKAIGRVE